MKNSVLVTSFGFVEPNYEKTAGPFGKLPPAIISSSLNNIVSPDYASLVLADELLMDAQSFENLKRSKGPFTALANTYEILEKEGYVRFLDYESLLAKYDSLLEQMVASDLGEAEIWIEPMTQSVSDWQDFAFEYSQRTESLPAGTSEFMSYAMHHVGTPKNFIVGFKDLVDFGAGAKLLPGFRRVIEPYLRQVNSNLLLSVITESIVHDWSDFAPLYRRKMHTMTEDYVAASKQPEHLRRLFEISFPEFAIADDKGLVKTLGDPRVKELRKLVRDATIGNEVFDEEFGRRTMVEVFRNWRKTERTRKIASYASLPFGLIPWVGTALQKGVDEAANHLLARSLKKKHGWFYLLTELEQQEKLE